MSDKRLTSQPTAAAQRTRIVAGILYAAARYVPVPLVDDLLREQVARWLVRSTLPAGFPRESTRALYADAGGCLGGVLRAIVMLPIKLLLFPVRKVLAILLGARWVARDVAEMILLGRVIDHALAAGLLHERGTHEEMAGAASDLRSAFDVAMKGTSTQTLVGMLGGSIGPVGKLMAPAVASLRGMRSTGGESPPPETTSELQPAVERIQSTLEQPEVARFVEEFDRRVIENLEVLQARRKQR